MKKNKDDLVEMGTCFRPHGIKGAFSFNLYNSASSSIKKGSVITLFPLKPQSSISSEGEEWTVRKISLGNKTIVELKGVDDRNLTESMLPFSIFFPRGKFDQLEDDEIYLEDLLGLEVLDSETEKVIGKIENYSDTGAQIILEIRGEKNFDIPFVDAFVLDINQEKNQMTVVVPEYLDD